MVLLARRCCCSGKRAKHDPHGAYRAVHVQAHADDDEDLQEAEDVEVEVSTRVSVLLPETYINTQLLIRRCAHSYSSRPAVFASRPRYWYICIFFERYRLRCLEADIQALLPHFPKSVLSSAMIAMKNFKCQSQKGIVDWLIYYWAARSALRSMTCECALGCFSFFRFHRVA